MKYFEIHSKNPQRRLIRQAGDILKNGGIIIYPTDTGYAFGCHLNDKLSVDRIRRIRQLDKHHNFTLICRNLSELGTYALVDNHVFRLLKKYTPGPFTFILNATKEVPRRLQHPKRKTIGLRVPDYPIVQALLIELNEPMMSVSLLISEEEKTPDFDLRKMCRPFEHQIDLILDAGFCGYESTTVVDLTQNAPRIVRQGAGKIEF